MKEKNIYLLKNLILFFLASFLPKTISFFLVPLYTKISVNHTLTDNRSEKKASNDPLGAKNNDFIMIIIIVLIQTLSFLSLKNLRKKTP